MQADQPVIHVTPDVSSDSDFTMTTIPNWLRGSTANGSEWDKAMKLFGPSQRDIDQLAYDLIVLHGLDAYDEAVHLSEVARLLPNSLRQSKLYRLAADQIKRSFEIAWQDVGQKRTGDSRLLDLIARLDTQGLSGNGAGASLAD